MMRAYEFMVIIDGDIDDPKAQAWVKSMTDSITGAGGSIHGKPDWWGKRQFAYPINRKEYGYYVVSNRRPGGRARRARAHAPHRGRHRPPQAHPPARCRGRAPRHDGRRGLTRRTPRRNHHMADNTVTLVGNLTRDPELRFTSGGRGVASFGVAVNRRYQVNGEWQEKTSFFNVIAWGTLGENAAASLDQGHPHRRQRPPRAARVGDPGRREAQRRRGRGRRDRSQPALGAGPGRGTARTGPDGGTGGGGGAGRRRPAAAAAPPIPCTATKSRSDPHDARRRSTMTSKKNRARAPKDTATRKYKKKTSVLITEKVEYVDYKDVNLLSRFMSDRAKIRNRRVSGNDVQQQRDVANAIKIAREMALLPYARRVSTQRTRPPREGDRSRPRRRGRDRGDGATPTSRSTTRRRHGRHRVDDRHETEE